MKRWRVEYEDDGWLITGYVYGSCIEAAVACAMEEVGERTPLPMLNNLKIEEAPDDGADGDGQGR